MAGVLPKGGINIAGHKVPWEMVGALAAVAGVILVIRARQQGSNVASVGQAPVAASPYTAASSGFGTSPDYSAALADISQQLANIQQTGINSTTSTTSSTAATDPNLIAIPSFAQWLSGAFTGQRPDLASAISQGRNSDLESEYAKEVASSEAAQLAAGKHF